jgi:hypothetical protein
MNFGRSNWWQLPMLIIAIGSCGVLLSGCAEEMDPVEYFRQADAQHFGLLTVTYHEDKFGGQSQPQVSAAGVFARYNGLTQDEVLSILNLPDTLNSNVATLANGSCRIIVRASGKSELLERDSVFVDLLDAGEIRLETEGLAYRLTRRSFPDIFLDVAGITYEGIFGATNGIWDRAKISLSGRGSLEVGEFSSQLKMPPVPKLLEIGGAPHTGEYASIDWDRDFMLRWARMPRAPGTPSGSVFVELSAIELERQVSLHCRSYDTGMMVLPLPTLSGLKHLVSDTATLRMVIRRLESTHISAAGIESAELHLISRDSVLLQ